MEFLMKIGFLQRLMGQPKQDNSRSAARERLQNALVGDRSSVAPSLLRSLELELLPILRRYMDVDKSNLKLALADKDGEMRFSASVPVLRIHRQAQLPEQALQEERSAERRARKLRGPRRKSAEDGPLASPA